jgi:hypothetical protein
MSEGRRISRRELLKSAGRYGALVGLIGGVGGLAARTGCRGTACDACPLVARCDLAKARETRGREGENGGRS